MDSTEVVSELRKPLPSNETEHRRIVLVRRLYNGTQLFPDILIRMRRTRQASATARWFMEQPPDKKGALATCGFLTVRGYIQALGELLDAMCTRTVRPTKRALMNGHAPVIQTPPPTEPGSVQQTTIAIFLTAYLEALEAEKMAKYAWGVQQKRVVDMLDMEHKMKIAMPYGNNHMKVLCAIGAEVRKCEMQKHIIAGKLELNLAGSDRPDITIEEVKMIQQLDPIDQNLMRDTMAKLIDLAIDEAGVGIY